MEISVVIPVFNEAKVIASTVNKVKDYLSKNFSSGEIIVVDDKSTDSTLEVINSLGGIKVLRNLKNHGKGYTVLKGLKAATGKYILFMDADFSTPISELNKLWEFRDRYQLIIGSRGLNQSQVMVSQPRIKVILGKVGNLFSRWLIHPEIRDTQCGFKLLPRSVRYLLDKVSIGGWAFDLELIYLFRKDGLAIKEVPVVWDNNFDSKVKWWSYPQTLGQLFKIRLNDLLGKY